MAVAWIAAPLARILARALQSRPSNAGPHSEAVVHGAVGRYPLLSRGRGVEERLALCAAQLARRLPKHSDLAHAVLHGRQRRSGPKGQRKILAEGAVWQPRLRLGDGGRRPGAADSELAPSAGCGRGRQHDSKPGVWPARKRGQPSTVCSEKRQFMIL